jgi:hypothetical protein
MKIINQLDIKAVALLRHLVKEKVREYELLCKKFPQFSIEKELPDGSPSVGGLLADSRVWKRAAVLVESLAAANQGIQTGTEINVYMNEVVAAGTEHPWP